MLHLSACRDTWRRWHPACHGNDTEGANPVPRILVVDDEEGVRSFLAEALEDAGHSVAQAGNGDDAAERLQREPFDLLITDLRMPGIHGLELVRRARAEHPALPVIVLTAHGTVDSAAEVMRLGAFDYVEKPIESPARLRELAARALARQPRLARAP
jgi:two-component system response regulator AtoC